MAKQRGLGKGLEALFAENSGVAKVITLNIGDIEPNKNQPRKKFDEESLADLASSITQHGILQPLIVRPFTDGTYQLVAGERRFRAAHLAGLREIPVVVKELNDQQTAEIALIENLQREDLNPIEEAVGFQTLMKEYSLTQEEVSGAVGKSRSTVANALRLLALPGDVTSLLEEGKISAGHARAVLSFKDEKDQIAIANNIVKEGLSVRDVESRAKIERERSSHERLGKLPSGSKKGASRENFYDEVELALTEHLGRKVSVNNVKNGGVLQIEFYSPDDLKMLANDIFPEN